MNRWREMNFAFRSNIRSQWKTSFFFIPFVNRLCVTNFCCRYIHSQYLSALYTKQISFLTKSFFFSFRFLLDKNILKYSNNHFESSQFFIQKVVDHFKFKIFKFSTK
ncbi:hypothetical protein BLOT_005119 [Blomia tropicalis]|nr:hypothetical protein BLOT_005119 [Blomia tropicalis]